MFLEISEQSLSIEMGSLVEEYWEARKFCSLLRTYFIEVSIKLSSLLDGGRGIVWVCGVVWGEEGSIWGPRMLQVAQ